MASFRVPSNSVDHVGSLKRPPELHKAWNEWEAGKLPPDESPGERRPPGLGSRVMQASMKVEPSVPTFCSVTSAASVAIGAIADMPSTWPRRR